MWFLGFITSPIVIVSSFFHGRLIIFVFLAGMRSQITLLSANPGRRFHLGPDSGVLKIGAPADLCLLVPGTSRRILKSSLMDRHRHSPYVGQEPTWRVHRTWVDGKTVFVEGLPPHLTSDMVPGNDPLDS